MKAASAASLFRRAFSARSSWRGVAIGTILILSDGSECVVAAFDAQGNPLCHPVGD